MENKALQTEEERGTTDMLLFQQMMVLFLYMLIGYFACKKGKLDEQTGAKLSWMVVNVANPMMILSSAVNRDGTIRGSELVLTALLSVAMFAALILIARLMPLLFRASVDEAGVMKLMCIFNNIGFMGFPVISAIYGSGALLYAAIFLLPYNVLFYTYGIHLVSPKEAGRGQIQWKRILNLGVLASILAVILYLTEAPTPQFFRSATQGLSNLTAPLSMIVIGISLARFKMKDLFLDVRMILFSLTKLLVIPLVGSFVARQFIANDILWGVFTIIMATPIGSMNAMLAQEKRANYPFVAKGVALSTILSVITIPVVSALSAMLPVLFR